MAIHGSANFPRTNPICQLRFMEERQINFLEVRKIQFFLILSDWQFQTIIQNFII
jgi:hypothetical protein